MQLAKGQLLACVTALLLGLGAAVLVTGADAAKRTPTTKSKTKKKQKVKLVAQRGAGSGYVPKTLLGPRWAKIGSGSSQPGATTTTAPAGTTTPKTTTPTTTTPDESAKALGVALHDGGLPWSVRPSKSSIPKGSYVVQMQNVGEDPHDLIIYRLSDSTLITSFGVLQPSGQPMVPSVATKQVNFSTPGQYRLFCSIDDHAARGMDATITVTN